MSSLVRPNKASGLLHLLRRVGGGIHHARRRIATCAVVVLTVMLGYHVVFGRNGLIAFRSKQTQVHDLRDQMVDLQQQNSRLRGHVDRLTSDPDAVEREAREALHYTRPGEVIYTLPSSDHPLK